MPDVGDTRYIVEYLDYAQAVTLMKADGADPDNATIWDHCSQEDITVRKTFPAKWRATTWAKRHKLKDVFHMPRIVEETFQSRAGDEPHNATKPTWEQTGYWEMDGTTEIEGD